MNGLIMAIPLMAVVSPLLFYLFTGPMHFSMVRALALNVAFAAVVMGILFGFLYIDGEPFVFLHT